MKKSTNSQVNDLEELNDLLVQSYELIDIASDQFASVLKNYKLGTNDIRSFLLNKINDLNMSLNDLIVLNEAIINDEDVQEKYEICK